MQNNKEKFMAYAKRRLQEKDYKNRAFLRDLNSIQVAGVERCARGKWRMGQR